MITAGNPSEEDMENFKKLLEEIRERDESMTEEFRLINESPQNEDKEIVFIYPDQPPNKENYVFLPMTGEYVHRESKSWKEWTKFMKKNYPHIEEKESTTDKVNRWKMGSGWGKLSEKDKED